MNILLEGTPYCDFQLCSIVDGLQELGHTVYDESGKGLNYMEPWIPTMGTGIKIDFCIAADTNNISSMMAPKGDLPKVVVHGHDRWIDYTSVPNSPIKPIMFQAWNCDIAFVRDLDRKQFHNTSFPVYPMEFGIERRFRQACAGTLDPASKREFVVSFFGTLSTAGRQKVVTKLDGDFKCYFGGQATFMKPDDYWSKWVNGRYVHAPAYYDALCNSAFALSPLGAGPSCGRTYEAYAAGCIPLIQRYPSEIKQIVPFVDGENCILWDTADQLSSKVRALESKPAEMDALQRRCYEFGQNNLLSKHRAQFMLDKIKEHGLIK